MIKKLVWGLILVIAVVIALIFAYIAIKPANNENSPANNQEEQKEQIMGEAEARKIAESICVKGGEALSAGTYNQNSKTWRFDANLNATKSGCNPACVVNAENKTAEINWRCTGVIPPNNEDDTNPAPFACTTEAKICPDGSAVGRTGPDCEFAKCPETNLKPIECMPGSRDVDTCIQIYDPVCALVQIQCINAPCNPTNQTFSNSCEACKNPLVKSYVLGECPN